MTPQPLGEMTVRLVTGWDEAVGLRLLIGLLSLVIFALTGRVLWRRECSRIVAGLWLFVALLFGIFALCPQKVVDTVIQTEYMVRIRLVAGGLSIVVLLITFEALRRTHLQERYALLWLATALAILTAAVFPGVVALFRAVTGMTYASAVLAVTFTFLVLVAFHFSISISGMQSRQSKIAQQLAILETRLRELEQQKDASDGG
ncbi:MAG: DUF2304 domain-containing protein [Lentisphaerae bacterium]|nr:DUF2304 domain-containing protein [Lentisphaerota bacterium]